VSGRSEPQKEKWRQNLSKYRAHIQDILLLFTFITTEDLIRKIARNFDKQTRAPDSSKEPRSGTVSSFKILPPKQYLHESCS
jgi:hypothetical protein